MYFWIEFMKLMMRHIFCFLIGMYSISLYAQTDSTDVSSNHTSFKTKVVQDYRIDKLNNTHIESYSLIGYRIQIYSGNKKQPAREARLQFSKAFKDVKAHETYQQPYFKVRVGDFRTKLEALKFQKELTGLFPNCFIVKDHIAIEELTK